MGYPGPARHNMRPSALGDLGLMFYSPTNFPTVTAAPAPTPTVSNPLVFKPPVVSGPVTLTAPTPIVSSPTAAPPGSPDAPTANLLQQLLQAPPSSSGGGGGGSPPDLSEDGAQAPTGAPAAAMEHPALFAIAIAAALGVVFLSSRNGRRR